MFTHNATDIFLDTLLFALSYNVNLWAEGGGGGREIEWREITYTKVTSRSVIDTSTNTRQYVLTLFDKYMLASSQYVTDV